MRHLWSLIAGLAVAPLAWLLLAIGQSNAGARIGRWEQVGRFDTAELIGPVIFLVVAGLLLGVIGTLRWSPLGPMIAGALLVAPTVIMFVNPFRALEFFGYNQPRRFLWQDFEPWLPVANGTLLVIGSLLLVATVSAQRWRRWPVPPATLPASTAGMVAGAGHPRPPAHTSPMSDDEILAAAARIDAELDRSGRASVVPPPPAVPPPPTQSAPVPPPPTRPPAVPPPPSTPPPTQPPSVPAPPSTPPPAGADPGAAGPPRTAPDTDDRAGPTPPSGAAGSSGSGPDG